MSDLQRVSGIIFVSGEEGVTISALSDILDLPEWSLVEILDQLDKTLNECQDSPIQLNVYNQSYRFVTKDMLHHDIKKYAQSPLMNKLSRAAIETLAIIAYKQPITRIGIDEIRGVSSQNMIQKLLSKDLIKTVGHVDAPGRPKLYGITEYFMDYFNLKSLEELPAIEPLALNSQLVSDELFNMKLWHIDDAFEQERENDNNG